jgi:hypothetical protein
VHSFNPGEWVDDRCVDRSIDFFAGEAADLIIVVLPRRESIVGRSVMAPPSAGENWERQAIFLGV